MPICKMKQISRHKVAAVLSIACEVSPLSHVFPTVSRCPRGKFEARVHDFAEFEQIPSLKALLRGLAFAMFDIFESREATRS